MKAPAKLHRRLRGKETAVPGGFRQDPKGKVGHIAKIHDILFPFGFPERLSEGKRQPYQLLKRFPSRPGVGADLRKRPQIKGLRQGDHFFFHGVPKRREKLLSFLIRQGLLTDPGFFHEGALHTLQKLFCLSVIFRLRKLLRQPLI